MTLKSVFCHRDYQNLMNWLICSLYFHRVDMFIPGVKTVGGFSICSTPEQLMVTKEIELAVKNSAHPPANWIHTQVQI